MNINQLVQTIEDLFTKRSSLLLRWQEIGENFYPERADFTVRRDVGDVFAENLSTSYPIMCRRNLGDQIGTMLRNTAKDWFHMVPEDGEREDHDAKAWLEWSTGIQRRAMYDRSSLFSRATKEADHDFAAFGQAAISIRLNRERNGLLFRTWHLRDVVWMENEEGQICLVARKWKPYAKDLKRLFGAKNHAQIETITAKEPFREINCYHIVVEAELYDDDAKGKPYWSIYYDKDHDHVLEAVAVWNKEYVIPRWQTVSGSQYAFSPATIVALPDARLIQAMTYTLLEAGEMAVRPPLIATKDVVKSDVGLYAGGITWVDQDYDERLGDALRPIEQDLRGIPIGLDMQQDARAMLMEAFYLNKLTLPERGPEQTAYEIGQRVQEYIRGAMPIFEPMEHDYNGQVCEVTFDLMLRNGAFGSPYEMPKSLRGANVQFKFNSPLHDAIEQQKGQKFLEMKGIIAEAAAMDPATANIPDMKITVRDVLQGIQVPAKWLRSEADVDQIEADQQQKQQIAETLAAIESGAKSAANLGKAEKDFSQVQ